RSAPCPLAGDRPGATEARRGGAHAAPPRPHARALRGRESRIGRWRALGHGAGGGQARDVVRDADGVPAGARPCRRGRRTVMEELSLASVAAMTARDVLRAHPALGAAGAEELSHRIETALRTV